MNTGVDAHARGGRVIQRCQNKNPRLGDVNDVMHWKRADDLGRFEKRSVELRIGHRTRRVDFRGSQRPDEFVLLWAPHEMGGGTD